ncbi:DUF1206 domain-containing protein [Streptomyces albus]|uniref:DUF1206 domain-containing protein n=1 Tax=Streptomyces albus TaxID=1888 RepID=A0A6C1C4W8_9ACTN|nr:MULTISPECIES: DUF1206 domain-containing protein [Streptomyces]EPD95496.1 hypothetical protein HMPREF1486_01693 [Streptomyces sp. HPH0547]QID36036.1 DUF1206 domain-containing protein [Streptomyces albus]TGG89462.1 DUF1206 domain-containing protein [Streptomyces albus]GHJ23765.1 membrane protein [Streptomyces albus]
METSVPRGRGLKAATAQATARATAKAGATAAGQPPGTGHGRAPSPGQARAATQAKATVRPVLGGAARAGFAARGVLYLLVGMLALNVAFGGGKHSGGQADRGGALEQVAGRPFGFVLLWALGLALAGMALWRLAEAAWGVSEPDGHKARKRLLSVGRGLFYAFVAYSVLAFAVGDRGSGSGASDKESQDVTAQVLGLPAGQWAAGAAGAAVLVTGVVMAWRAALRTYHDQLCTERMSRRVRRLVDLTGVAGGVARGLVFAAAGGFLVRAALAYRPRAAKGMDDTLRAFTETPAGPWLLVAVAAGLALFGLFSFAEARWRRT